MRKLKKKLYDGDGVKTFTFTTLPRSIAIAFNKERRSKKNREVAKEIEELEEKFTNLEASDEEIARLDELEEERANQLMVIVCESMGREHKDFRLTDSEEKNKEIFARLNDMLDMRDIQQICMFAIQGTITKEENELEAEEDLDLT